MLRVGGGLFLMVAGLLFAGLRFALLLDALVTGICGVILAGCSLYWIAEDGPDILELLYVVFSILFLKAAVGSFGAYRRGSPAGQSVGCEAVRAAQIVPPTIEPQHPASIHPNSLPQEGEPAPPDGYLAALSKEKGEPPDAGHR